MTGTILTVPRSAQARKPATRSNQTSDVQLRLRALSELDLAFIPNQQFQGATAEAKILGRQAADPEETRFAPIAPGLPPHLARLCESTLLTTKLEADLFRRMNYLKFRVDAIRQQLNPDRPNARLLTRAEQFVAEATAIRHRIVKANMRLVMSIVKKFIGPQNSFDDLLSDGTMAMLRAVDKFDFAYGFHFSTYAYRVIVRTVYQTIQNREHENARFAPAADQTLGDVEERPTGGTMSESTWIRLKARLADGLDHLDRREQLIIRSRFALGLHRKVSTFQNLGNRLGISKERVRQLEQRAIGKLRTHACNNRDA